MAQDWRRALEEHDFIVTTQEDRLAAALLDEGVSVAVTSLVYGPKGDCCFAIGKWSVGVEIKSAQDLMASLFPKRAKGEKVGRLTRQLKHMLEHYDRTLLVVHGPLELADDGNTQAGGRYYPILFDAVWNTLALWQERGVRVQFARDIRHVAHRLVSLKKYLTKKFV